MTDIIEVTPSFEQYAFTFGGVAPLRKIAPGTVLRLWSDDAFCGALRSVTDLSREKVDLRFVNPQTGPFYVEGAEPGDTLALHLVSLEPARDWGASAAIPFFGGLTSTDRTVTLQDAFNGALRSVDDRSAEKVDLRFINPQTGPFHVEGAEPGDTLQASSSGRLEPTVIMWSSSSSRGQPGAEPLISSTINVVVIAPSTAVPHDSPSPWR